MTATCLATVALVVAHATDDHPSGMGQACRDSVARHVLWPCRDTHTNRPFRGRVCRGGCRGRNREVWEMGKRKHRGWSDERRAVASTRAKARWDSLTADVKEARLAKSREAYEAKYPERLALSQQTWAAIKAGTLTPGPCSDCGKGNTAPEFDYEALKLARWSHYECRKARAE